MFTRRTFVGAAAGAIAAVHPKVGASELIGAGQVGTPVTGPASRRINPVDLLDSELRAHLSEVPKPFDINDRSLPMIRSILKPPKLDAAPAVERRTIPGMSGQPTVSVLVTGLKQGADVRPAVLHIHGGGYVGGKAIDASRQIQTMAVDHDCVVVSVDYRLAPEVTIAGSLEDNYAGLLWLYRNARDLGVDPTRIVLYGASAGGGHAAMLSVAARDRGEVPLRGQILIYPMLDDRTGSSRQPPAHIGTFAWSADNNRYGWSSLLAAPAGATSALSRYVPARVTDLSRLPPTYMCVGTLDLFVEEDLAYANRLIAAGVPTELLLEPGVYHGFDIHFVETRVAERWIASWNDALERALRH